MNSGIVLSLSCYTLPHLLALINRQSKLASENCRTLCMCSVSYPCWGRIYVSLLQEISTGLPNARSVSDAGASELVLARGKVS